MEKDEGQETNCFNKKNGEHGSICENLWGLAGDKRLQEHRDERKIRGAKKSEVLRML